MSAAIAELVELGDLDELTRMIDRLCQAGDWDGLVELTKGPGDELLAQNGRIIPGESPKGMQVVRRRSLTEGEHG